MADYLPERKQAVDEVLAHYGVKGMRWGVITKKASRGVRATGGALKAARQKSKEKKAAKKAARTDGGKGSYKKFSDSELQRRIKRLEQEQRYRELKADRHTIRGRKVARDILENGLTKAGSYAVNRLLKTGFDNAFEAAAAGKASKAATSKAADEAVKKTQEAANAVAVATAQMKKEWDARPPASSYAPKSKVGGSKPRLAIEKPKSYKQGKPSFKPKRYPRNPGSSSK